MSTHSLDETAEQASAFSFAKLDASLTAPPVFLSAGCDGTLTLVARGDHIPARYRRAMHAFRFSQYWRLGFLDAHQVDIDVYCDELVGYPPDREFHTIVLDRHSGRAAAYVYLAIPDPDSAGAPFALEKEYDLTVGETIGKGLERARVWEAKRLVRRVGMPWSSMARNSPWWAMLGMSQAIGALHKRGHLDAFVADGAPDGSPRIFELLGFDVHRLDVKPRVTNVDGRYGPMWRQRTVPVPYICENREGQGEHLRGVEEFLQGNQGLSVRETLAAWRQA
ncbi:hypothetical protein HUT18_28615 [Streptomyces sp. NA04227]|uniref:hypothetical protein n=1 Tax=Streptomyces sp. NA04227 TaxID=2742136 RepID=UPI001592AEB7|nr:hypothetical protein [Streptomyces sp. NA04227]QKW09783.1 hypothetical protein HUT18_28615 [Streptomyces sp. NA04227]